MDVNLEEKGLKELKQSTARLTNVIEEEIRIIGDSKKVFIGGLSQGCATSLYVGTGFKKPLGGILGFIGWVVPITEFSEENKDIPIFLGHGKLDPLVPFEIADKTYDTLKGGQVTRYVDPEGDHWITLMMAIKARDWLLDICSKQNAKTNS
jgi:predicted esterase